MRVATAPSADAPLQLVELPNRPLGPRDLRVRVRAIGVNPVDWKMRSGWPIRLMHRFLGPSGPLVVGIDLRSRSTTPKATCSRRRARTAPTICVRSLTRCAK